LSKTWYLTQNPDVKESGIPAFMHFMKYGRNESRFWREPTWFRKAFGSNGWVRSSSNYFFNLEIIDYRNFARNYKEILIYRPGLYKKEIKKIKCDLLNSNVQKES
jgi:hypothetical protein